MAILTTKKPAGKLETIGFLVSAKTGEPVAEIVSTKTAGKKKRLHKTTANRAKKSSKRR